MCYRSLSVHFSNNSEVLIYFPWLNIVSWFKSLILLSQVSVFQWMVRFTPAKVSLLSMASADEVSCDDSGILRKTSVDALCDRVWSPSPLASFVVEGCCCWWHKTVLNSWQAPHQQRRHLLRAATELLHMACSEQFFELLVKTTSKTGFIL